MYPGLDSTPTPNPSVLNRSLRTLSSTDRAPCCDGCQTHRHLIAPFSINLFVHYDNLPSRERIVTGGGGGQVREGQERRDRRVGADGGKIKSE